MHQPFVTVLAVLAGLIAGSLIVWAAPRLTAYRLAEPIPLPGAEVLVPVGGVIRRRWRLVSSLAVELSCAALLGALASHFGWSFKLLISGVYTCVFVAVAYIDVDHRLVLNRLSYPAAVLAVPASLLWNGLGWQSCLLGGVTGGLIFWALWLLGRGALGMGDVKLAVVIGEVHGFPGVFDALLLGMLFGGAAGLILLVVFRRGRKQFFAYAPYLAAGGVAAYFLGS